MKASISCPCLLLAALSPAADGAVPVRTYDLPGHGRLEFSVPGEWKEEVNRPPGDLPPTIEFSPAVGNEVEASVEKEITLKAIKGAESAGSYFTVTDRAPKKDEWTYLTEGAAGVGDLLVSFTILTNSLDSGELRQALRMIESCRQIKSTEKPPVPPRR